MKKFSLYLLLLISIVVLSGCKSPEEYLVNFEVEGGLDIEAVIVIEGDLVVEPVIEDIAGHTFIGWFNDETYTYGFDFETVISGDVNLYAKWIINQYTISYFVNSDSVDVITRTQDYGSNINSVDVPIKEGYSIVGWYEDEAFTIPYSFNNILIENIAVYLLWEEDVLEVDTYSIALITEGGIVNDGAYVQAAWEGVVMYGEENSISYTYYIPLDLSFSEYLYAIERAVENGAEIIVLPSWLFSIASYYAQALYPSINFILVDGTPRDDQYIDFTIGDNMTPILFNEHEAGFLAGYATVMDGYTNLGFIGGVEVPTVVRYGVGYIAGAFYAAEMLDIEITFNDNSFLYADSFAPEYSTQALAASLYTNGVEVIFGVAGGGNYSIIVAAAENDGLVIGADVDMSHLSDTVLTSAMKNISIAVYHSLTNHFDGTLITGEIVFYGVEEFGVVLPMETSRFTAFDEVAYNPIYADMISGEFIVPSTTSELTSFFAAYISGTKDYPSDSTINGE